MRQWYLIIWFYRRLKLLFVRKTRRERRKRIKCSSGRCSPLPICYCMHQTRLRKARYEYVFDAKSFYIRISVISHFRLNSRQDVNDFCWKQSSFFSVLFRSSSNVYDQVHSMEPSDAPWHRNSQALLMPHILFTLSFFIALAMKACWVCVYFVRQSNA